MSKILIQCDRCHKEKVLSVRQPHEARNILSDQDWSFKDESSRYGGKKRDYCPDCSFGGW